MLTLRGKFLKGKSLLEKPEGCRTLCLLFVDWVSILWLRLCETHNALQLPVFFLLVFLPAVAGTSEI